MSNISGLNKEQCCGCTACKSICPINAISMVKDEQGFKYPNISEECVNCGLCIKVCPSLNKQDISTPVLNVRAVKHKDDGIRKQSSSGGIGYALCEWVINQGGIVFGVSYDDHFNVITTKASSLEECKKFFGSKYVQTDLRETFAEICSFLLQGKNVLFFGTSCHVAGLYSLLDTKKIDCTNLLTVDLICHGVPSPELFSDYIKFINKKRTVEKFEFRTKKLPWLDNNENYGCTITYKNGRQEINTLRARLYLNVFQSNNCLRPYCYTCPYTKPDKPSDITISDFWGIQNIAPEFYDELGVSGVICHSQKGQNVLNNLENIITLESTIESLKARQANLKKPSQKPTSYDAFWKLYKEKGFMAIAKNYAGYNISGWLKRSWAYKVLRRIKKSFFA